MARSKTASQASVNASQASVSASQASVEVTDGGEAVLVSARGEFDVATAPLLEAALSRAVAASRDVLVDLREASFMDARGVHEILVAERALERLGCTISLRHPSGEVRRVLELTGAARLVAANGVRAAPG